MANTTDHMTAAEYQAYQQEKKAGKKSARWTQLPAHLQPPNRSAGAVDAPGVDTPVRGAEFIFLGRVPGVNGPDGYLRISHREYTRRRKNYEAIVRSHISPPLVCPVRLELVRHSIGRNMDYDGLVSTGKLLIDAIVNVGILPDDTQQTIVERSYQQTRALDKQSQFTLIRLITL